MVELPKNTVDFLASIGCTAQRIDDNAWIINDPLRTPGVRLIMNGATISAETKFPRPGALATAAE